MAVICWLCSMHSPTVLTYACRGMLLLLLLLLLLMMMMMMMMMDEMVLC
jgi:hypothetical protein